MVIFYLLIINILYILKIIQHIDLKFFISDQETLKCRRIVPASLTDFFSKYYTIVEFKDLVRNNELVSDVELPSKLVATILNIYAVLGSSCV